MNEDQAASAPLPLRPAADGSESVAQGPSTPGGMLRAVRQSRGLALDQLAVMLKVQPQRLQALEADRLDLLPDLVYARALYGSACRYLKVDAGPMMALLPHATTRRMHGDDQGLNASFQPAGVHARWSGTNWVAKPMVWLVVVLVLAIALVLFWPRQLPQPMPSAEVSLPGQVGAPSDRQTIGQEPPAASAATPSEPAGAAQGQAPSEPPASRAMTPTAPAPAESKLASAASPTPVLTLQVEREVWLSVRDAAGVVQLQKTAQAGESLTVDGVLPLSVVLGRADAVAVHVRGQSLDLAPWTTGNVARFEVK
jgi:cytoskeleton protein RodZ